MTESSSSSSSSTTTPVAYSVALENGSSAHPALRLSLPASFLDAPNTASHDCRPSVLLKLPPGLFVDPYTFPVTPHLIKPNDASSRDTVEQAVTLRRGRGVIRSVRLLDGANHKRDVELERGTGYTLNAKQRAELRRSEQSDDKAKSARLLSREYTAALIHLHRVRVPDVAIESQAGLGADDGVKSATQVPLPDSIAPKAQLLDVVLPLHTRYPIPLGSNDNSVAGIDWRALGDAIIWPTQGSYDTLLLEQPHAFWSCRGEGMLAVDSGIYEPTTPLDLLAPMHTHLQVPSPPPMALRQQQLYRLSPPSRASREPFRINVPVGQAELGPVAQLVTLATLVLAALYIVRQTSVAVRRSKLAI